MTIMPIDPLELLNTRQMAARAGVSEETPEMWRKRKKGPPFVKIGRTVRYRTADVVAWLEANTVKPEQQESDTEGGVTVRAAPAGVRSPARGISPHLRGMRGFN